MRVPPAAGRPASLPASPPVSPTAARAGGALLPVPAVPTVGEAAAKPGSPFDRAGVDVGALLASAGDSLVARPTPSTVALADVLERARAALVRGAAADALAALDDAWDGASRTEGGWYYRAASLAALGRATEAERLLQAGLKHRPRSGALLFLRSLLEQSAGNTSAAWMSGEAASALQPDEPLLVAWRAVLLARQGDRPAATALLKTLAAGDVATPLLEWARAAAAPPTDRVPASATGASAAAGFTSQSKTALEQALQAIGASVGERPPDDVRDALQRLIRAMSVGGTLHATARPEPLAAARSIVASLLAAYAAPAMREGSPRRSSSPGQDHRSPRTRAVLDALADSEGVWRMTPNHTAALDGAHDTGRDHANEPLRTGTGGSARSTFLAALQESRLSDAQRALAAIGESESPAVLAACRALLLGAESRPGRSVESGSQFLAHSAVAPSPDERAVHPGPGIAAPAPVSVGTWFDPLLTPVRLGLALLQYPSAHREAMAALGSSAVRGGASRRGVDRHDALTGAAARSPIRSPVATLVCLGGAVAVTVAGFAILALPMLAAAVWAHRTGRRDGASSLD